MVDQESAGLALNNEANPYWCFICNPAKWAIDEALADGISMDHWGIRSSDAPKIAPGHLGVIRVGVDRRSKIALGGKPRLAAGIYAIVEVLSRSYLAQGADPKYWYKESLPGPGRPTVDIRYLRSFPISPLPLTRLNEAGVSPLLIEGFQASSMPISSTDFHKILLLLGEDEQSLTLEAGGISIEQVPLYEEQYLDQPPQVRHQISKRIERGPVGAAVKKALGYRCQVCESMGQHSLGFAKASGGNYVEAHHVMPVSKLQVGSLHCSNIMVLCANHHRQMHYGFSRVEIMPMEFKVDLAGEVLSIRRPSLAG